VGVSGELSKGGKGVGRGIVGGRGARFERDWTKGSIIGNLWFLSWPMTISSAIMTLGPAFDMIWVGKLGAASIAGVGISGMVVMMMNPLMMGLFTGLRALVARFVGAGDNEGAGRVAQQAFVISGAFGTLMAIIGILLSEQILLLMGLEADVVAKGAAYMRIQFIGMMTMSFSMTGHSLMQASGDAVTPMKISIISRILHVTLCPFLVFGWWIFPRLEVSGAALTGVLSQGVGGAILLWILFTGRTRVRLTLRKFQFDWSMIWRMVKIGIPASVTGMERSFSSLILVRIIATFGTLAVASHSLGQRVEMFIFMPAMGLGQGASVLAGQNLGARQPERAEKTAWLSVGLVGGVMLLGAVAIWFWADNIVRIFNSDPGLIEIASTFLRIAIAGYLVMSFIVVLSQCLTGVGDTLPPMIIGIASVWLVQLPLAYSIPQFLGLGVYGVRWAMVASMCVETIAYVVYFRHGRWKRKEV
jgi:putative MATE family efflux protein